MPKNREKFKLAAIAARKEKALDAKNAFGITDPTPKEAVNRIKGRVKIA